MYVSMDVSMYIHMYICMYVCMYICIYVRMYVCNMYVRIFVYVLCVCIFSSIELMRDQVLRDLIDIVGYLQSLLVLV